METTLTTSGDCGYRGYGYGDNRRNDFGTEFCDLQMAIGETKARIEKSIGDNSGLTNKNIGDSTSHILTKVGDAECNINTNVKDVQYSIVDKMTANSLLETKDRADIAQRQAVALNAVERDIQNRVHENRQILSDIIHTENDKVIQKVSDKWVDIKNQLTDLQLEASKNTASIILDINKTSAAQQLEAAKNQAALMLEGNKNTEAILAKLNVDNVAVLTDKVASLRYENERGRWMNGLANQNQEINSLKQMLNSVEQNQRFGSKTVQFGTGNTSGTAQTANQG